MSAWVLEPNQGRLGYLSFLPSLYSLSERGPCFKEDLALKHAVLACAGAAYANVYDLPRIRAQSLRHYSSALREAQRNCGDPNLAKTDSSLASILLLQLFEVSSV